MRLVDNIFVYITRVTLVAIILTVATILYWLYSVPKVPLTVDPNPITVTTHMVASGSYALLRESFCKYTSTIGTVDVWLVSTNTQLELPEGVEAATKGCHPTQTVPIPVPSQATPGTYHYHFRVFYQFNPIRSNTPEFDTESFQVGT